MSLYTWNDSIPSLAAGSLADLRLFDAAGVPLTDEASAIVVQTLIRNRDDQASLIQETLKP